MKDRIFLDTNILVYYFHEEERTKKLIARNLVNEHFDDITISTQILGELFNVLKRSGNSSERSSEIVKKCLDNFLVDSIEPKIIIQVLKIHLRYGFSYYDCLVICSALNTGCSILYTEDLQHNQLIENNLRIINPFK